MSDFIFGVFENQKKDLEFIEEEHEILDSCFTYLSGQKVGKEILHNKTVDKIRKKLLELQQVITVFHFCGHHNTDCFPVGEEKMDGQSIAEILNNCPNLKIVFLNGCSTNKLNKYLTDIPIIIGTEEAIRDKTAADFAIQFYYSLSTSLENFTSMKAINNCFELAKASSRMSELKDQKSRSGINLSHVGISKDTCKSDKYKILIREHLKDFNIRLARGSFSEQYSVSETLIDVFNKDIKEQYKEYTNGKLISSFNNYANLFPVIFSFHLNRLDYTNNIEAESEISKLSAKRVKIINRLYENFITLCRYSITALLIQKKLCNRNNLIPTPITKMESIKEQLNHLIDIIEEIKESEQLCKHSFIDDLIRFMNDDNVSYLKYYCNYMYSSQDYNRIDIQICSEKFFHFFITELYFLTYYKFIITENSDYWKFIFGNATIDYVAYSFSKNSTHAVENATITIDDTSDSLEVFSVYLVKKKLLKEDISIDTRINLTPFMCQIKSVGDKISLGYLDVFEEASGHINYKVFYGKQIDYTYQNDENNLSFKKELTIENKMLNRHFSKLLKDHEKTI